MTPADAAEVIVVPQRLRPIPAEAVRTLYDEESWWPERTLADLRRVIEEGPAVGAWHGSSLVGFARAVTDGRFRAYVEDVVVRRDHRGAGCAGRLLDCLHGELDGVEVTSVFCHERLAGLYVRAGYGFTHQQVAHRTRGGAATRPE